MYGQCRASMFPTRGDGTGGCPGVRLAPSIEWSSIGCDSCMSRLSALIHELREVNGETARFTGDLWITRGLLGCAGGDPRGDLRHPRAPGIKRLT